jgi:hypothetical protein
MRAAGLEPVRTTSPVMGMDAFTTGRVRAAGLEPATLAL